MEKTSLFRSAALEKHQVKWLGEVVLLRPLSFLFLTGTSVSIALLITCFLMVGEYTKRSTVSGQLVPDTGILKIYSPQLGIVLRKLVREGQPITKGDVLYVVSSERQSSASAKVQATVSQQVALRQQSLRDEILRMRKLQRDDENVLQKKINGLQAEHLNVTQQIAGQQLRVDFAVSAVTRASELLVQGYVSAEMAQQKQADLLDQRNRLAALERDKLSIERELQAQRIELTSLPLRQHNDLAQIERLLTSTDQEWAESEGKRQIALVAPEDGIATAVLAEVGQTVDGSRPLATIIPHRAMLEAQLFASSRAIGFIRPKDRVLLRYQAYPYQKFGHALGTIASVSRVAISTNEATGLPQGSGEQVYRITVTLLSQTINAYGRQEPLQAGMLVDADIFQEKRKLYEWVLEPIYSLSGKL